MTFRQSTKCLIDDSKWHDTTEILNGDNKIKTAGRGNHKRHITNWVHELLHTSLLELGNSLQLQTPWGPQANVNDKNISYTSYTLSLDSPSKTGIPSALTQYLLKTDKWSYNFLEHTSGLLNEGKPVETQVGKQMEEEKHSRDARLIFCPLRLPSPLPVTSARRMGPQ